MRFTDMADEMFGAAQGALPAGVRLATAKRGGVTITRVEIAREGMAKPRGRYVTLEMPSVSVLDERDAAVIETCAAELRALLPPEGPVLVLGIGNRRVTADALGPRTAQKILVTMGPQHTLPVKGIRPVAAIAPGVSASTGLTLRQLAGAMVEAVRPAALICVDSLCSAEGARLGRSVQFSDTGLYPAQADHAKHLDAAALGVPVIAAGIPTLMDSDEGADLVVTPRGAGQRDRPRLGSSGRCHQPGLAAKAQRGAAVLAGGVTPWAGREVILCAAKHCRPPGRRGISCRFWKRLLCLPHCASLPARAALMLAAAITAPLPMAETLFWLGRQSAQEQPASSVQVEAAPDSTPEAAASSLPQAVQALTGNIEDYLVPLLGEEARPADAGTVIEKNYPQGSGEKYIPCGAGSIKNNTRQTAADIAAEIENPLPFAIEPNSPDPQVLVMHTHATEDYRLSAGLLVCPRRWCPQHRLQREHVRGGPCGGRYPQCGRHQHPARRDPERLPQLHRQLCQQPGRGVQQYLARYPSIKVVLDVHRDAIETESGSRYAPVCMVDGGRPHRS